jgi:hypothetical protein
LAVVESHNGSAEKCRKAFHKAGDVGDVGDKLHDAAKFLESKPTVKTVQPDDDSSEFSWNDHDLVVVPTQMGLAVYENPHGDIVIRQAAQYPDEDVWVVVSKENLVSLILRLQELSREFDS